MYYCKYIHIYVGIASIAGAHPARAGPLRAAQSARGHGGHGPFKLGPRRAGAVAGARRPGKRPAAGCERRRGSSSPEWAPLGVFLLLLFGGGGVVCFPQAKKILFVAGVLIPA